LPFGKKVKIKVDKTEAQIQFWNKKKSILPKCLGGIVEFIDVYGLRIKENYIALYKTVFCKL
jgi:hypothetical protein